MVVDDGQFAQFVVSTLGRSANTHPASCSAFQRALSPAHVCDSKLPAFVIWKTSGVDAQ
jgi:hypothetical protein